MNIKEGWDLLWGFYIYIVDTIVPGPRSLSYFVPWLALPLALFISPKTLSRPTIIGIFMPVIFTSTLHAWQHMHGPDVISVDAFLWAFYLLVVKNPREDFEQVRLHRMVAPKINGETLSNSSKSMVTAGSGKFRGYRVDGTRGSVNGSYQGLGDKKAVLGQYVEPYPVDLKQRLLWVISLISSTRMTRWKIRSVTHDQRQEHRAAYPTRWNFVRPILIQLCFVLAILFPVVTQLYRHDPYFWDAGCDMSCGFLPIAEATPNTVIFFQQIMPKRLLRMFTLGYWCYCALNVAFLLPCAFAVLLNYMIGLPPAEWSPHTLPHHFGPFSSVLDRGLAGVWGTWWHQHMRLFASGPGEFLADSLHLQRNSSLRYALLILSGFFFSGVTHAGMIPPFPKSSMSSVELRLLIAQFFWIQSIGIILEMVARGMVTRARALFGVPASSARSTNIWQLFARLVRLSWVLLWLSYTLPLLRIVFRELSWWYLYPVPIFPIEIQRLLGGAWIP